MKRTIATALVLALCIAGIPTTATCHWEGCYYHDDDDEFLGYAFVALLLAAAYTSPVWVPMGITGEFETHGEPTRFLHYPYEDNATGFMVIGDGPRPMAVFTDFGASIVDDTNGRSISTHLMTQSRFGLRFNQVSYEIDSPAGDRRGASSLHATYMFARNKNIAFSAGLGGRHQHHPVSDTTLSVIYQVDCFPTRPFRLTGTCEYDGETHFRVACSTMFERFGAGIALRSEVVDETRYRYPELFMSMQF